ISELDKSQPMFYRGSHASGGHAFVCDGYQLGTPNFFHFNWGWGGSHNGYFKLDSLDSGNGDYTDDQGAIVGVEPNTSDTLYQICNSFENWTLAGWNKINNDSNDDSLGYYSEVTYPTYDLAHIGHMGLGVYTDNGSDDWAVTNQIFLTDDNNINFSFWARSYNSSYLEDINVKLSTTSNNVSNFSTTLESITDIPNAWTQYSYDLSSYSGDSIYLAVQSVGTGHLLLLDDFVLTTTDTGSGSAINENTIPNDFTLKQNYPNPFNPQTTIEYSIPQNSFVKISVYNLRGEKIKTVVNENKIAGNYSVIFDGSNFASGIYFYRIEAGNYSNTKKLILMK
ncbi:MAG: choice-of-anchor J domain-containing protein, partial [Candidatus Marinimicrobia bacterium]|nr:choice-of-anchor J domain-containing protein [Candidatus Neomarinimicrobiota bacterium]